MGTSPISLDRDHFVNLTRGKILIVGCRTFADEDPTGGNVGHVRLCIVVSRTLDASDVAAHRSNVAGGDFPVASDEITSWRCEGTSPSGMVRGRSS